MLLKIRELVQDLKVAGFRERGGKGSHRDFKHPGGMRITISGSLVAAAKPYQEQDVKKVIARVSK